MTPRALQILALMQGAMQQQNQAQNLLLQELADAMEGVEAAGKKSESPADDDFEIS